MKFVILNHTPCPTPNPLARTNQQHFDLMFEVEAREKLISIAVPELPIAPATEVDAESLADHRVEYLSFEGELTQNRGTVIRFAWGTWDGDLAKTAKLIFDEASVNFQGETWELRLATNGKKLFRIC
jgi:hypothetical protein